MRFWPYWRFDGYYWTDLKQGFSWNETRFPNLAIIWAKEHRIFYLALAPGLKVQWFRGR